MLGSLHTRARAGVAHKYDLFEQLGAGSHSKVFRGVVKSSNVTVAIKVVDKTGHFRDKAKALEALKRESDIIMRLQHPVRVGYVLGLQRVPRTRPRWYYDGATSQVFFFFVDVCCRTS